MDCVSNWEYAKERRDIKSVCCLGGDWGRQQTGPDLERNPDTTGAGAEKGEDSRKPMFLYDVSSTKKLKSWVHFMQRFIIKVPMRTIFPNTV